MISKLFVDDDAGFLGILSSHFKEAFIAADAVQARYQWSCHGPFDVVVTDLQMPGEDGLSLADFIHKSHSKTKIILLSSYFLEKEVPPCITKYILKPIDMKSLEKIIQDCFN